MSDKPNDGGPAFPTIDEIENPEYSELRQKVYWIGGMSLRDWFAGQPLSDRELESVLTRLRFLRPSELGYSVAEIRYFHADAMIAERDKTPTGGGSAAYLAACAIASAIPEELKRPKLSKGAI